MDVKLSQIIKDGGYNSSDADLLINALKESDKYKNRVKSSFRGTVVEGDLIEIVNDLDTLLKKSQGYKDRQEAREIEKEQKIEKQKQQNAEYIRQQEEIAREREKREAVENAKQEEIFAKIKEGQSFALKGNRGRSMVVYKDRVVITVELTAGSLLTGNVSDGEKTIFFKDVIGIQYKASGGLIGYLQFETASGLMNNASNNMFNENTFTFDAKDNDQMRAIANYVIEQIAKYKQVGTDSSAADEIKKYKELLDLGAITTDEYEAKKKQLLNI